VNEVDHAFANIVNSFLPRSTVTHPGTHIDAAMRRFARNEKQVKYFLENWPLDLMPH
jgi:hypothetical protein